MKYLIGTWSKVGMGVLGLLVPLMVAQAVTPIAPPEGITTVESFTDRTVCAALNWLYTLALIVAVIFILLAAFKYITAGGDPEQVKSAGRSLLYAVVGIAVALLANGVPGIVNSFFEAGGDASASDFCS
jgi:fumarate reductase subunit D